MARWTFLTNHAHVLICVSENSNARVRDIAQLVGVTERAAQRIITELEEAGYLVRERAGRRNTYRLNVAMPLRHAMDDAHGVGELLATFARNNETTETVRPTSPYYGHDARHAGAAKEAS